VPGWKAKLWRRRRGELVEVLRGIPNRRADLKQDFGDLMQEGLDRATAGQVQFDAILVLDHPHGEFEQFQDHRGQLGVGQFGMDQNLGAQRLMQDIGSAGEKQAQVIGKASDDRTCGRRRDRS
jgi:hypothetical protein